MRLVNYGTGEVADRLTILALKLAHAPEGTGDHFRNEYAALLTKLTASNGISRYLDELLELATLNGRLWRAEDELRAWRRDHDREDPIDHEEVRRVAFRIQSLNDRRAQIVEAINVKTGEHLGSEKAQRL